MFRLKLFVVKNVCAVILCVAVVLPSSATAQTTPIDAQIQALTASIASLAAAIASSTAITEPERINLLQQTIALSTAIFDLRASLVPTPNTPTNQPTPSTSGVVPTQIVATVDVTNQTASVDASFASSSSQTFSYQSMFDPTVVTDFDDQIGIVRATLITNLAQALSIAHADVDTVLLVTGYNPQRDTGILENSPLANDLADEFSVASIVNRIVVQPGTNFSTGVMTLYTDRDERIDMSLTQTRAGDPTLNREAVYDYQYSLVYPSRFDPITNNPTGLPIVSNSIPGILQSELDSFLLTLENDIPFTSAIPNFSSKLQTFLLDNPTTFEVNSNRLYEADTAKLTCVTQLDRTVFDAYVEFILDGLKAQHYPVANIIEYESPVLALDNITSNCKNIQSVF